MGLLAAITVGGSAAVAQAQVREAALSRIGLLNKQAMDDYDSLEFEAAEKKLFEALSVADGASIAQGKEVSTTYLNLGIVYGAGLNDRAKALEAFGKALRADPAAALSSERATPALQEIFTRAKAEVGPVAPRPAASLQHEAVRRAPHRERIPIQATISEGAGNVECVLYYRPVSRTSFIRSRMQRAGGACSGGIPSRRVRRPQVEYFIELQDDEGERIAGSGTRGDPHVIVVEREGGGERGSQPRTISISLLAGTGAGIVFGGASEHLHPRVSAVPYFVDIQPGVALSPMHIGVEIAYHLTRMWRLSVLARLQVLTALDGVTVANKNPISFLGVARAKRYFGMGTLRPYLSFGAGGGQVRHRIALGDYDPKEDPDGRKTPNDIVDARIAGYIALAFGGGLDVMFTDRFGLAIDANGAILVWKFAAHLDLSVGVIFNF